MYGRLIYFIPFLFLILFTSKSKSFAYNFPVTQYSVNEGLSQSLVTAIYQDKEGYLWIGTGDGLNKFDGIDFTIYKNNPGQPFSISGNTIRGIIEDPYGNLWIGTESGLNYFNKKTEKFTLLDPAHQLVSIPFYADSSHIYFWDAYNNIVLLNFRKKKFTLIKSQVNLYKPFYHDNNEKILYAVGADNELIIVDLQNKKHKKSFTFPYPIIAIDKLNDDLIISTSEAIYKSDIHIKNRPFNFFNAEGALIRKTLTDNKNNFWIFYDHDLEIRDAEFQLLKTFNSAAPSITFLNLISKVYTDRSGIVWAGTDGEGIFKLSYNNLKFKNHFSHIKNPLLLGSGFIKSFFEDKNGNLYIGTFNGGLSILSNKKEFHKISKLPWSDNNFSVNAILEGTADNELIISTGESLLIYNISEKRFKRPILVDPPSTPITAISKKVGNQYYVGTEKGLIFAIVKKDSIYFRPINNFHNKINALYKTRDNGLFICTGTGYNYLNENGVAEKLISDPDSLLPDKISYKVLFEDENFNWIGSNYGLVKLDKHFNIIKLYGIDEGLPDLMIYGILKDKDNNLWLSSNKGLSKFNITSQKATNFSIADGLQSFEFNSGAFLLTRTGKMVFGGINGFNIFDPDEIKDNQQIPNLSIIRASVFDKSIDINLFKGNDIPKFPWFDNTLNFELVALESTEPLNNRIAFKLEGLEDEWYYIKNKRNIRFTSLQPGKYILWAKSSNSDDIWSEPRMMAEFKIQQPFWQSWFFIIPVGTAFLIFIGCIIYFFSTIKYRKKLIELEKQREIGAIRDKISRDIHDDIGSGLTRITLLTELIKANSEKDKEEINKSLHKLSEHSRELATNLGEIVWTVNPVHDNLNSLLAYLRNYIAGYLEDAEHRYKINFPSTILEYNINPELRRNLFMVVKEALNNIVKHAQAQEVHVNLQIEKQWMILNIEDDGIGISEEKNPFGNGLINMQQRMEKIGGEIFISRKLPTGTSIHIKVRIY